MTISGPEFPYTNFSGPESPDKILPDPPETVPHPVLDPKAALTPEEIGKIAVEHDPKPSSIPELGPNLYLP